MSTSSEWLSTSPSTRLIRDRLASRATVAPAAGRPCGVKTTPSTFCPLSSSKLTRGVLFSLLDLAGSGRLIAGSLDPDATDVAVVSDCHSIAAAARAACTVESVVCIARGPGPPSTRQSVRWAALVTRSITVPDTTAGVGNLASTSSLPGNRIENQPPPELSTQTPIPSRGASRHSQQPRSSMC